jgi:hypothetical protein
MGSFWSLASMAKLSWPSGNFALIELAVAVAKKMLKQMRSCPGWAR